MIWVFQFTDEEVKTYWISSQSSLSFQPRLASDTWDPLRTNIPPVSQTATGQKVNASELPSDWVLATAKG